MGGRCVGLSDDGGEIIVSPGILRNAKKRTNLQRRGFWPGPEAQPHRRTMARSLH